MLQEKEQSKARLGKTNILKELVFFTKYNIIIELLFNTKRTLSMGHCAKYDGFAAVRLHISTEEG